MKFICLCNDLPEQKRTNYGMKNYVHIRVGKIYEGKIEGEFIRIDRNVNPSSSYPYENYLFKELSEYRNEQIDSILKD